jgi:hypothetical protein
MRKLSCHAGDVQASVSLGESAISSHPHESGFQAAMESGDLDLMKCLQMQNDLQFIPTLTHAAG